MRNNPDDLSNQLINKIKKWLKAEISDARTYGEDADVDSRELGILDGRYEMALQLKNSIKKWEKEND